MDNEPTFGLTAKGRAYLDAARRPRASTVNPFALALDAKRAAIARPRFRIIPRRSADSLSPAA